MLKCISPDDPESDKLIEAYNIASSIAMSDKDSNIKGAMIMRSLTMNMDGFPVRRPSLASCPARPSGSLPRPCSGRIL